MTDTPREGRPLTSCREHMSEIVAALTAPQTLNLPFQPWTLGRLPLVRQGIQQAQQRVLKGQPVPSAQKVLSLFEPHTRVVIRGKIAAAVEFGRQVVVDEVEGGVVTRFRIFADEESACRQVLPAVVHHRTVFGRPP